VFGVGGHGVPEGVNRSSRVEASFSAHAGPAFTAHPCPSTKHALASVQLALSATIRVQHTHVLQAQVLPSACSMRALLTRFPSSACHSHALQSQVPTSDGCSHTLQVSQSSKGSKGLDSTKALMQVLLDARHNIRPFIQVSAACAL